MGTPAHKTTETTMAASSDGRRLYALLRTRENDT